MRYALLALLLPALLRLPSALAQDNEAENLFRDFEKKVKNVKAIRVAVDAKSDTTRLRGNFKISLLLAQGNKLRLLLTETDTEEPDPVRSALTSNGTTLRMSSKGKDEEKATPKGLHTLGSTCASRAGIIFFLLLVVTQEQGSSGKLPDSEELLRATEFKLAKDEKVGGRDAKVVRYKLNTAEVTLWLDARTHLPIKRHILFEKTWVIAETYTEFLLDPKVDAKAFKLSK